MNLKRLITCADRLPRPGETVGVDYHFVTPKELDEMSAKGNLVEKPQSTGTSRKGTPRSEFDAVLSGGKRLWRIDPYLASKVVTGVFFDEEFSKEEAKILKSLTKVICIESPKKQIEDRRKGRDGKRYNPEEYKLRDIQEKPNLEILEKSAILVKNLDKQLEKTVEEAINHIFSKVLVGGCFDILHYGHIHFLKKAKSLGDCLVVALESDKNIKKMKGEKRPIHDQNQRREMLKSLEFVDEVIILPDEMRDEDYLDLVTRVRPLIIATTEGDPILSKKQKQARIVGAKVVEIPKIKTKSTSQILDSLIC
jgi:rfaE bifunctional protein nucleotidyltransferase chain/domain